MKLIHCADLHLDSKMTANLPPIKARERRAELLKTFGDMITFAAENAVDAIIIAGDLYDVKNISASARNMVCDAIMNNPAIDFYYLRGNHDAESLLGSFEALPPNLHLFGESWTSYSAGEKVVITGAELSRSNYDSIYGSLDLGRDKFNIVVLHGQETEGGADFPDRVSLRELRGRGIDYLALGHVHSYKSSPLDSRGTYCYPGCLEGRGFDECGEHGFVLLDVDEDTGKCTSSFVPAARRRLCIVQADITGCKTTTETLARVREALSEAGCSGECLVKLVLVGETDVESERDISLLEKQLEDEFYFLKIADESSLKVDYAAFAADASLKGEFVRAVLNAALSEEDKAAVIRCGIRALAGEELFS